MIDALFDLADFAPEAPAWATECFYCRPDKSGVYDEARHVREHLPLTCSICGETSPNRLIFEMNHEVTLGGSWGADALLCVSLSLRLNHLTYAVLNGRAPDLRDLTALDLGWRIAPDGAKLPPAGWPTGAAATRCEAIPR